MLFEWRQGEKVTEDELLMGLLYSYGVATHIGNIIPCDPEKKWDGSNWL